jgi:putative tricarboxylic transport membrane protein
MGFPFGTIPAGGSEIPTFLSYGIERKLSKHEHEFGTTGAIEGVAGPEAANNAAVTATLVPLLTLGIPTSVTAAILLSALQNYGINAGPQLFQTSSTTGVGADRQPVHRQRDAAGAEPAAGGPVGQAAEDPAAAAVCGHPDLRHRGRLRHAAERFDLYLMLGMGLLGVVMRRFDFPTAPVIVGMILGPLAEAQMRNALSIGEGHWGVFLRAPDVGHAAGGGGGGAGAAAPDAAASGGALRRVRAARPSSVACAHAPAHAGAGCDGRHVCGQRGGPALQVAQRERRQRLIQPGRRSGRARS